MRDDLNASEKRLIAALDRIDRFVDDVAQSRAAFAAPPTTEAPAEDGRLHEIQTENRRLAQELAQAHERQATALATCEARLAEAHQRLVDAGQEAARLAAANEALISANRALIGAGAPDQTDITRALQAEAESLRAARAAEIAQMGDILDTLDRMAGAEMGAGDAPAAMTSDSRPPVMVETPFPARADAVAEAIADEARIDRDPDQDPEDGDRMAASDQERG